jgi:hypothetical protein
MTLNRRSFLTAIAGALCINPAELIAKSARSATPVQPLWRAFMIMDSATLEPGKVLDDLLFPGVTPVKFEINRIALGFNSNALVADLEKILGASGASYMQVLLEKALVLESPMTLLVSGFGFYGGALGYFPSPPLLLPAGGHVAVRLCAPALNISAPVQIDAMISGIVDVSGMNAGREASA